MAIDVDPILRGIFGMPPKADPRDPDLSRVGIFRDHNCARCNHGAQPCVQRHPHRCAYPHARND